MTDKYADCDPQHLAYALKMPIVGYRSADPPPEDMKNIIIRARLAQLEKEPLRFPERSTKVEAMWYISTASLAHPLDYYWMNIYEYLTRHYMLKWKQKTKEKIPEEFQREVEISLYEKQNFLDLLRADIRETQFKHMQSLEPKGLKRAQKIIDKNGWPLAYVADNTFELEDGERFETDSLAEGKVRAAYDRALRDRAATKGEPVADNRGQLQIM
jgi:hypothetical protein